MSFFSNPLSFFMNPWTVAAGALLALMPIIIHLINRMRFRRVKWAAMEFLLKAQKKQKKKKILEQLILLLLRILLVLLAVLLLGRFRGTDPAAGKETRPTQHVVIIDDTPSMADIGQSGPGEKKDALSEAKRALLEIVLPRIRESATPQHIQVLQITNPDAPFPAEPKKLDAELINDIRDKLAKMQTSSIRRSLLDCIKQAKTILDRTPSTETAKVLHVLTDLRALDWSTEGEAFAKLVQEMSEQGGVKVHLIDVASPPRELKSERKLPPFSDNVGIIDLKPRNRVAAINQPVDFEIQVENFGSTDLKEVGVQFFLNGQGNVITSVNFPTLPARQKRTQIFPVTFTQMGTKDKPLDRFNIVTAVLTNTGSDALALDNARHAVVEVREKLAVLVIGGRDQKRPDDGALRSDKKSDGFYLRRLFEDAFGGIEWVHGKVEQLEKEDLRRYSTIYLLNVDALTEGQANALEKYVREGGGVGVFLGPDVKPDVYNALLYKGSEGFFPVPLPGKPTDPLSDEARLKRGASFTKRVLLRDSAAKTHPALAGIYTNERGGAVRDMEVERFFYFAYIDFHWPISRLGRWREDPKTKELYCLPNDRPTAEFEDRAVKLIDAIKAKYGEPKFEKYRGVVDDVLAKIRAVAGSNDQPLTELARQMDRLLADQVSEGDPSEALLREFWGQPDLAEVKVQAESLRDSCKYGDPLYLAKKHHNGRVAVMTTAVADPWTDWPVLGGSPGWVAVVTEMQKYLSGGGAEENRSVGSPLVANFEAGRYDPRVPAAFLSTDTQGAGQNRSLIRKDLEGQTLVPADGGLRLNFTLANEPGVYLFSLKQLKRPDDPPSAPSERPEYMAVVFNVDTAAEGDLRRASTDDIKQVKGVELHSTEDWGWVSVLQAKQTDLSSGRWIYLMILVVLILEQAMAVRVSYHAKPEDLAALSPTVAAVFSHGTPPPAATEGDGAAVVVAPAGDTEPRI